MCVFASLRGHDLRSMLVQVMMTADPLISVAFYETTPPKIPIPQVPAWETRVSQSAGIMSIARLS